MGRSALRSRCLLPAGCGPAAPCSASASPTERGGQLRILNPATVNAISFPHLQPVGRSSFPEFRLGNSERRASLLSERYGGLNEEVLLRVLIREVFPGRIALVSSLGAESAILMHLVSLIEPSLPVIFLNTEKHFPETLAYRKSLVSHFGLKDFREVAPDPKQLSRFDPDGDLSQRDSDFCCQLRKVLPLEKVLTGFDAWITGRKRLHGGLRENLRLIEAADGKIKVNPLVGWSKERLKAYYAAHDLPRHPLTRSGFTSVGCAPCTRRAASEDSPRDGRWAGQAKTECGIHIARQTTGRNRSPVSPYDPTI